VGIAVPEFGSQKERIEACASLCAALFASPKINSSAYFSGISVSSLPQI